MNDSPAIFCAAFIAVLIPAALVGGVSQSASVLFIAGCIAAMHVVFLGLPAFLMLRRFKLLRWWSVVLAGILCGIIPMAVTSWPHWAFEGASYTAWDGSRMVEYVVNGVPTVAGWWRYVYDLAGIGLFGGVAALASWLTYSRLCPNISLGTDTQQLPRAGQL